jgi:periplasmic divalent cation tolerance protein
METNPGAGGQEICVIWSTVPPARSSDIAERMLEKNLVACVSILPVRSRYRWKGEPCNDEEHLLIMKTRRTLVEKVIRALRAIHPYEVPEIIVLPVVAGHPPYAGWVHTETDGA